MSTTIGYSEQQSTAADNVRCAQLATPSGNPLAKFGLDTLLWRIRQCGRTLTIALEIWHERQQLLTLSDNELRDMGIDPIAARQEARKRFLDIPANRISD